MYADIADPADQIFKETLFLNADPRYQNISLVISRIRLRLEEALKSHTLLFSKAFSRISFEQYVRHIAIVIPKIKISK